MHHIIIIISRYVPTYPPTYLTTQTHIHPTHLAVEFQASLALTIHIATTPIVLVLRAPLPRPDVPLTCIRLRTRRAWVIYILPVVAHAY